MDSESNQILLDVTTVDLMRALESTAESVLQDYGTKLDCQYDCGVEDWDSARRLRMSEFHHDDIATILILQLFRDEHRLERSIIILDEMKKAVGGLQIRLKHRLEPISSRLGKGLTSLPDELLAYIFDLAVSSDNEGRRNTVWLSHVSRRFRRIVIGMTKLWTVLHSKARKDELETVISRSGINSDLQVIIRSEGTHSTEEIISFFDTVQHTSSRWTTLRVSSAEEDEDTGVLDFTLKYVFGRLQRDLPRFQEFHVDQKMPLAGFSAGKPPPTPFWAAPNLRVIRCENYIPFLSSSYSSVTSFDLTIPVPNMEKYYLFSAFLSTFLGFMRNISKFTLTVPTSEDVGMLNGSVTNTLLMELSSITSFTLNLPTFQFSHTPNSSSVPFLRPFHLPNLTDYSISVGLPANMLASTTAQSLACEGKMLNALLPDYATHPNLTSLSIEIACSSTTKETELLLDKWHIAIPLGSIPYVRTLDLKTFVRPHFTRHGYRAHNLLLQDVHFRGWRRLDKHELNAMVDSLTDVGVWKTLRSVTLGECAGLLKDEDLVVVQGAVQIKRRDGTLRHIVPFD